MKRFIVLVLVLSITCLPLEARRRWIPKVAAVASTQYFGSTTIAGASTDATENQITFFNQTQTFTCPGSGTMTIQELSAYCDLGTGTGTIRLAIYNAAGTTLIAQGTAAVTVVAGPSWQGHLTQASMTPNPATLTGGTNYTIAISIGGGFSNKPTLYVNGGAFNAGAFETNDYTTIGFPATLSYTNTTAVFLVRCGVQ